MNDIVTTYIASLPTPFGADPRMFEPMLRGRDLTTHEDCRQALIRAILDSLENPNEGMVSYLDDLLMIMTDADQITVAEARAIISNAGQYDKQFADTMFDNAPSEQWLDEVQA